MARYSEQELNKLKQTIDLVALVQSKGIKLEKHGKDLKGLCPFHKDSNPSLIITPDKNLFNCPACGTGGDVISFVQKFDGVSFTHAVELLMNGDVSKLIRNTEHVKHSTVRKLKSPIDFNSDDQAAIKQAMSYYASRLPKNPQAIAYLKKRGIYDQDAINTFKIGFSDRSLGLHLPTKQRKEGRAIRERLANIGLYRESGHEHFNGSLVFPIIDDNKITEIYGRKITHNLRKGTPDHLYLPGPHLGVWNRQAFQSKDVILCEAIIDALSFWIHGFKNVTASYGIGGFTKQMLAAFIEHKVERVFIAYDNDDEANNAATRLASTLTAEGIKCFRVKFPFGLDANGVMLRAEDAKASFKVLLNSAEFMQSKLGASPEPRENCHSRQATKESNNSESTIKKQAQENNSPLPRVKGASHPCGGVGAEPPASSKVQIPCEIIGEDIFITLGERKYRIRGLEKNTSFDIMKINIRASRDTETHIDTLDLFNARHRKSFTHSVADELKLEADIIKRDIGRILLKLEELQEEALRKLHEPEEEKAQVLTEEEQLEALELLRSPNLIKRIIADVRKSGLVGEDVNALVAYLAASSRKTDDPLAVIIQSSSSAGKSSVMNAILALMPEEEQVIYTAMTGQSLFYMGENQLKHKILAIAEEEGAEQAGYALKILQSEKKLKIASTGKDPKSGRLVTQEYNVEGPCVIFMTTTSVEIDEELQNRCLVLTVNEDREQTRRIHELQRKSRTLEGLLQKEDKTNLLRVHTNAQRMLQPLMVVNPFAHQLTFLDNRLRARRDNIKYLNLINAIALIHQYQREIKAANHQGSIIPYIEVQISDIEIANKLAGSILGTSLDDLAPQTRKLLELIYSHSKKLSEEHTIELKDVRLTRRSIRAATGWTDTRLRVHLQRLLDLEYIHLSKGSQGKTCEYELLYQGQGEDGQPFSMNLIDIKNLTYDSNFAGVNDNLAPTSHTVRTPFAGTSHTPFLAANTSHSAQSIGDLCKEAEKPLLGDAKTKKNHVVTEGERG